MRDAAGAIADRTVNAQTVGDCHLATGAIESRTDAFCIAMVTLGTNTDDATADGDSAAGGSVISAADACTEALTLGCDSATRDADVAAVILVTKAIAYATASAADASSIGAARGINGAAGANSDVAAMANASATNTCTPYARSVASAGCRHAGRAANCDASA